ncbi:DUF4358 domain-containing protein [Paenibacillus sp. FSL M7-1455]|uniref:DUF4358 domain-containing protein n=1 Tax=Paenibacillus sp. FSL M7-1455 TaxID=2975316 RepID=UPI0005440130|nr:hypothetical protein CM49_04866 [Paenibacillus sp. P1XP2]
MNTPWKGKTWGWLAAILAIAVVIGLLSGCEGGRGQGTAATSLDEIGEKVGQSADLKEMKKGDLKKLQKLYNIDPDAVDGFILYTSNSNVRADEWAVIQLKDPQQAENVKAGIGQRIAAQKIKFKDYRPNEFFLVENHVLKTKGSFVFFAVSQEAEQMEKAFDDAF